MLSKVSADEVFMHYFEKMSINLRLLVACQNARKQLTTSLSSISEGLAPRSPSGFCPWAQLGDFRPSDSLIAHPGGGGGSIVVVS